jgi:hypothetical protein
MSVCISEVIRFIKANYRTINGPPDIAEALDMNYHTLRAAFKRETGRSMG